MTGWFKRIFSGKDTGAETSDADEPPSLSTDQQREMIEGVREFHETVAREVMVPRTEIRAVEEQQTQEEAISVVLDSGYSRIPVFREHIDNVVGVVHAKDLLRCLRENCADKPLAGVMREPYFVPETKRVSELLADFKTKRVQLAIVLDEYGGTAGLATIEDLIEEIVGEIEDEYDAGITRLTEVSADEILVTARVEIHDVEEFFRAEIECENATTVGGWITESTGAIPAVGEEIEIDGFRLKVESADERRVGRVRIRRLPAPEVPVDPSPD